MTFNLNRVNFGARVYNPTIGRWDWVDPLAEEYYSYSTFSYTLNNPIIMIDADGNYLGDGGKDDGKVYQLESKYRARFENKNVNQGGTLSEKHYIELQAKSNDLGVAEVRMTFTGEANSKTQNKQTGNLL